MWSGSRAWLLERHDFYVDQVKARVLSQFSDLEGEADRHADREYERLNASLPEEVDVADVSQMAYDRAQVFYELLYGLDQQMRLSALAGLYHQWDKDLRDFIEGELSHDFERVAVIKSVWQPPIVEIFDLLKQFGWDCTKEPFYPLLDACRLVVNVFKHGKGNSLKELAEKYPQFLADELSTMKSETRADWLDHEWLRLSVEQFDDIAAALRAFWVAIPERQFLEA